MNGSLGFITLITSVDVDFLNLLPSLSALCAAAAAGARSNAAHSPSRKQENKSVYRSDKGNMFYLCTGCGGTGTCLLQPHCFLFVNMILGFR